MIVVDVLETSRIFCINLASDKGSRADEGSSREFEKKHGTDWFANAVNTQLA